MPNFSSLARLEVPEKFVGGGWVVHSHYIVKPNLVLKLDWGFDNKKNMLPTNFGSKPLFKVKNR